MCGRGSLTTSPEELQEEFGLVALPRLQPRYNIAPSEPILAVRAGKEGEREGVMLRWGLLRPGSGKSRPAINLRIESVAKGAMRRALREHRCIVPLSGFYEWKRAGKARQPFNVHRRDGKVFGVAGLWDRLDAPGQPPVESCVVLTTDANPVVRPIHGRMPVILAPSSYERWLEASGDDAAELVEGVEELPADALESYPVSPLVNRAGVEDPRCLDPAPPATLW
jgi:putative SOS response-associated peptidase YedK